MFYPCQVWLHCFVDIDDILSSRVILSLSLIQEGHLSLSGKKNVHKYWLIA